MDWDRIERDLHAHAYAAASIPKIPTQISTSSPFKENNGIVLNSNGNSLTSFDNLSREVDELKSIVLHQNKKINVMEKMLNSYNEILDVSATSNVSSSNKLNQLEHEFNNLQQAYSIVTKENKDLAIAYTVMDKKVKAMEKQYVNKDIFTSLIDSMIEQMKTFGASIEGIQATGGRNIAILEGFMLAFQELEGNDNLSNRLNIDLFTSDYSDYRDSIVKIISETLSNSIQSAVFSQSEQLVNTVSNTLHPIIQEVQSSQQESLELVSRECLRLCNNITDGVNKTNDTIARLVSKQEILEVSEVDIRQNLAIIDVTLKSLIESVDSPPQYASMHVAELDFVKEAVERLQKEQVDKLLFDQWNDKMVDITANVLEFKEMFVTGRLSNLKKDMIDADHTNSSSSIAMEQDVKSLIDRYTKLSDEQENLALQVTQLRHRVTACVETNDSNQLIFDTFLEKEAILSREIDDIKQVKITKLQNDTTYMIETLEGSHKRLQQGVDTLQEELVSLSELATANKAVMEAHDKAITDLSDEVKNLHSLQEKVYTYMNPTPPASDEFHTRGSPRSKLDSINRLRYSMQSKDNARQVDLKYSDSSIDDNDDAEEVEDGDQSVPLFNLSVRKSSKLYPENNNNHRDVEADEKEDDSDALNESSSDSECQPEESDDDDDDDDGDKATAKETNSSFTGANIVIKRDIPTPSDLLQSHLKMRMEEEHHRALARTSHRADIASVQSPNRKALDEISPVLLSKPILSGSLLTGRNNTRASATDRSRIPIMSGITKSNDTPLYASIGSSVMDGSQDGAMRTAAINTNATTAVSRSDTTQCPHCLRRYPKVEVTNHTKSCDLRTELCTYGCGTKVRFIKMKSHLDTCIKRHLHVDEEDDKE